MNENKNCDNLYQKEESGNKDRLEEDFNTYINNRKTKPESGLTISEAFQLLKDKYSYNNQ